MAGWATIDAPLAAPAAFSTVMSEQLADHLDEDQRRQASRLMAEQASKWACSACTFLNDGSASLCSMCFAARPQREVPAQQDDNVRDVRAASEEEDFHLAMRMQREEQQAYQSSASKNRGSGKVFLTPHFFPQTQCSRGLLMGDAGDFEPEDGCNEDDIANDGAPPLSRRRREPNWPRRDKTLKGQGGNAEIITKHDPEIATKRNLRDLEASIPAGMAGDLRKNKGTRLSSSVTNSLKSRLKRQTQTAKGLGSTVEKDGLQTHAKGLDQRTRLLLFGLVNAGLLDEVNGAVRTGKEAVVYHAVGRWLPPGTAANLSDVPGFSPGEGHAWAT